jgi:hypothetical protein
VWQIILLVLLAFWSSGCIWLAVPELAYEGYKYEHESKTQTKDGSSSGQANRTASSDHSIE